jgi:hypothetical protein
MAGTIFIQCGRKHKTQQACQVCLDLTVAIDKAKKQRNKSDEAKYTAQMEAHTFDEREERIAYATRRMAGQRLPRTLSIGMDAIDSFKCRVFSHKGQQLKNSKGGTHISDSESFSYKTTGVLVHGWGYKLYIGDAWVRGDGNFNIHCLHKTLLAVFEDVAAGMREHPHTLHIQVDGGSDNKNGWFFDYVEYLVRASVFEVVTVGFEIVGHTHDDYDRYLAILWRMLKQWTVNTIHDLVRCARAAYTSPEFRGVEVVQCVPDYKAWFAPKENVFKGMKRQVPDMQRPHFYEFTVDKDGQPTMSYKNLSRDHVWWNKSAEGAIQLLNGVPDGKPPLVEAVKMLRFHSISLHFTRFYSILLDLTRFYSMLLDSTRFYSILLDFTRFHSI